MSDPREAAALPGRVDPALVMPVDDRPVSRRAAVVPGKVEVAVEPLDAAADATQPALVPARRARWGLVLWLLAATVVGFCGYSLGRWLLETWQRDWLGATALGALLLAFLAALAVAAGRELRAIRRLHKAARFRAALDVALEHDSAGEISAALAPVLEMVAARRPDLVRQFHHRVDGQSDGAAMVRQFRAAVLLPLDREARQAVRREALATLTAATVSPHPALDVVVVAWRSVAMVRRVAEIYGLRPSGLSAMRLTRTAVIGVATAMAADPAGDALAETLGGGLADKLAGKVVEGSIVGWRALRLGMRAIEVCRPLAFEPEERTSLLRTLLGS